MYLELCYHLQRPHCMESQNSFLPAVHMKLLKFTEFKMCLRSYSGWKVAETLLTTLLLPVFQLEKKCKIQPGWAQPWWYQRRMERLLTVFTLSLSITQVSHDTRVSWCFLSSVHYPVLLPFLGIKWIVYQIKCQQSIFKIYTHQKNNLPFQQQNNGPAVKRPTGNTEDLNIWK